MWFEKRFVNGATYSIHFARKTGREFLSDAPFSNLCFSVRSRFTIKCGGACGRSVFLTQKTHVTGELSVSYIGVGIKGGSRSGHGPPLSSYRSAYSFCRLTFVYG